MKLNSPTYTDSTDEPTPLGLFSKGKDFKFNPHMIDQMDDTQFLEGIGFDENITKNSNLTKDLLRDE
jgi:hypothetical protein